MAPSMNVNYGEQKEFRKNLPKQSGKMMGKSQKLTRGYLSSFVSDYRHAVDNVEESEGLGSSGRVDTEMTVSEDSSGPKRKCISLNIDSSNGYGVPVEIFRVSKMSRLERKQLELRLKAELDQVKDLQRKIAVQFANVAVSSSGDIRGMHRPLQQEKKKPPFGPNSQGPMRGSVGKFVPVKQDIPPVTSDLKLMEQCEALLKRCMSHDYGWVFNTPVDVVKLNIPDYFTVIKHPMDLGTVKSKIASGEYSSPWEFLADVRLTFSNAMTYNPAGNDVHIMAKTVSKFFEMRWKNIQKKLPPIDSVSVVGKPGFSKDSKAPKSTSPSKKRKLSSIDHRVKTDHKVNTKPVKRTMTVEEKDNLARVLMSFEEELPNHISDFLLEHYNDGQTADGEMSVDIHALSDDILFTLKKLVDDYMQEKRKKLAKVEPSELEFLNESGVSNSSMQPAKGGYDPIEEDVDIGGNDLPVSSYPPVEIEKDTAHRSSKCSSSSSSGSDSSSSSSDSDTGSSSSSDSDGAKDSSPISRKKENNANNNGVSIDKNQSRSKLDHPDQNSQSKPISFEADSRQAEDAPAERQVSPEKLYRAALLRNRFADTILKAREKTLDQVEKGDPQKLRHEREELERQQKEEKARLQAEAIAAENARRQAEAEAAAEAKRKREAEREAARQALQQIEKTVEINESSHFLKDLEMLRSASGPDLPLADATISSDSLDGMCGFKLQASSNPLEQLGLFMKADEEEEEEEESDPISVSKPVNMEEGKPTSVPKPQNDAEEGEVD